MNWTLKSYNELTLDELYDLLRLRCEIFIVEQVAYQDIDDVDKSAFHLFTKDENDRIIAYLRIMPRGIVYGDAAAIGRLCVSAAHRRKGIAGEMLDQALAFIASGMQEHHIHISAQEYLKAFYESRGFVQCGEGYLEDDIPHIPMERTVSSGRDY